MKPRIPENCRGPAGEVAPIGRRKRPVLEVGPEKVKVNDPEDRQSLRNIEPEEPFHLRPAVAAGKAGRK